MKPPQRKSSIASSFNLFNSLLLNLARRMDRRLQALDQCRKAGIKPRVLTCPDAANVEEARSWRNKGARACAAAHRLAWREMSRGGMESAMIFEDDVVLVPGFLKRLQQLRLPEDWQILYFGCVMREAPEVTTPGILRLQGPTWDMHAYVIRTEFAREASRLLQKPSHKRGLAGKNARDIACDVLIATLHRRYSAYTVWPPMAWQRTGLSNNENCVRGNYRPDGRQIPYAHIAAELDLLHGIDPDYHPPARPITRTKQSR